MRTALFGQVWRPRVVDEVIPAHAATKLLAKYYQINGQCSAKIVTTPFYQGNRGLEAESNYFNQVSDHGHVSGR